MDNVKMEGEQQARTRANPQSERLYLEPLTAEKHLEDFHELWIHEDAVKYSYVFVLSTS
jgi:hypothetical protein